VVVVVTSMVVASTLARTSLPLALGEHQLLTTPALGRRLILGVHILRDLELVDELV
jgi:hypothetical protein